MGRPFQSELEQLAQTIHWVSEEVLPKVRPTWIDRSSPAYCIGSGGSQSAADFLARLVRSRGGFAWATTPLEFLHLGPSRSRSSVFLLSASGRNKDIVSVAKAAIEGESVSLRAVIARRGSPLAKEVSAYACGDLLEMDVPTGKDGFLATNSLVAMMVGLTGVSAAAGERLPIARLAEVAAEIAAGRQGLHSVPSGNDVIIIHAGWGGSAALDLESKLSEAALASAMLCDLRNFGHGRHHWLAKRAERTVVVTVEDRQYERLFDKTLGLLPPDIRVIRLRSELTGPAATIDLTIKVFGLVRDIGLTSGVDPGRPGVPEFGRKIYHLSYNPRKSAVTGAGAAVKRRSRQNPSGGDALEEELLSSAAAFGSRISEVPIRSIVCDYDGTLVDTSRRFEPPDAALVSELVRLLRGGLHLGVATGRGRSVRESLRNALPTELWRQVTVGYYNGGQIIRLDDDRLPNNEPPPAGLLRDVGARLEEDPWLRLIEAKIELRPEQLSVTGAGCAISDLWTHVTGALRAEGGRELKCVASTHSVDILPARVTKLSVVEAVAREAGCPSENVLCVGDSGLWPGNDSELLAHFPSLSCGSSPQGEGSGWNFAPLGVLESRATLHYLSRLDGTGPFRLDLG